MNIAFSAVIISILLIPPVVFYISLYYGRYSRATPEISIFEGILSAAVISLLIHCVAISICSDVVRFDLMLQLLGVQFGPAKKPPELSVLSYAFKSFARYNFWLLLFMLGLGRLVRLGLLKSKWHINVPIFQLYNKWWYVFSAYRPNGDRYDLVFVDVLAKFGDKLILYSGFLENFDLKGGDLSNIYLKDAVFRPYTGEIIDETPSDADLPKTKSIQGNSFCIKYEVVINMNLTFVYIDQIETPSPETTT
jgi:hypothetical protein